MLQLTDVIDCYFEAIAAEAIVTDAITQLNHTQTSCLLVVTADQQLVGTFSSRDVVRLLATQPNLNQVTVQEGMSRSLPFLRWNHCLDWATVLALFQTAQATQLPVVDEGDRPIGWLAYQKLIQVAPAQPSREEARFRPLFEQAAVGVVQVDLDGRWQLVNQTLCGMLGYLSEELIGLPESMIVDASDLPATRMYYQSLLAGDAKTYSLEERFTRKDHSTFWVSTSTSLVRDETQQPQYFIKIVKDISEQKRAEKALRRQLNRALLLQKVTDAIRSQLEPQQIFEVTVTQVGQAFNVNRCLLMTYRDDLVSQFLVAAEYVEPGQTPLSTRTLSFKRNSYAEKVLFQDRAVVSSNVYADRLLQPMESSCQEFSLKSMLTVRTSYQGEPNGALTLHQCDRFRSWTAAEVQLLEAIAAQVGIALAQVRLLEQEKAQREAINQQNANLKQEIHKRKQAEIALSRSNAALQAQQEVALDGILVVDENRQVCSYNRRFCEVWKIPPRLVQQHDSRQLVQHVINQLENPQEFLSRVEYLYQHPDEISHEEICLKNGQVLERYSAPVRSSAGDYYGRVWFFRDISERTHAKRQLAQRQRYLTVLVEIQRYLLAANLTPSGYTGVLQNLGQACRADRVYLFENHCGASNTLLMSQRAEWCAAGIRPEIDNPRLQNLSYNDFFPRWTSVLSRGESINGIVNNFPESERQILEPQGIQAILILPLMVNQTFWGFIGFDNCTEGRPWSASEISLLSVAASAISLYQERQQAEVALRESIHRERAIVRVIERMRKTLDLDQIFNTTVEELRHLLKCDRVVIFRFNADWSGEIAAESCLPPWQPLIHPETESLLKQVCSHPDCQVKNWGTLYPANENLSSEFDQPKVKQHFATVSHVEFANLNHSYRNFLQHLQAKASLVVPIYLGNFLWGLLASYQNAHPRNWSISETTLVRHISTQLGIALQQAKLFRQTRQQSADLEKAKDAAEAANRAKSEFLTNISHELRTPLNAILGFTQVMSHDVSNPKHREYIDIINRSGQHLLKVINDVLEMSKIEAGRQRLNVNSFDFYHLLDTLYEMLLLKSQEKHLTLTFEIASDVPQYITTDESKLRQVLLNLLGNAIKFTHAGHVWLRISQQDAAIASHLSTPTFHCLPAHSSPLRLHFEVEDSGSGMSQAEITNLFTPFMQAYAGQQASEGTGLGLAISQKFVELMGGKITVQSTPGRGSCFQFDSCVAIAQSLPSGLLTHQRVVRLQPGQPTYRILVVEDRWENQQLLVELLQPVGFEVRVAVNGAEGVKVWREWQPQLILMDIRMPVMDGYEATRQIQACAQADLPIIIAITSSAFEEDRTVILNTGCHDFISKPFQEEIIFAKLAEHLGVTYIYEQEEAAIAPAIHSQKTDQQLLANMISEMPKIWIKQLYEAAIQGRDTVILDLLQQIPEGHARLTKELYQLTTNFEFETIINQVFQHQCPD